MATPHHARVVVRVELLENEQLPRLGRFLHRATDSSGRQVHLDQPLDGARVASLSGVFEPGAELAPLDERVDRRVFSCRDPRQQTNQGWDAGFARTGDRPETGGVQERADSAVTCGMAATDCRERHTTATLVSGAATARINTDAPPRAKLCVSCSPAVAAALPAPSRPPLIAHSRGGAMLPRSIFVLDRVQYLLDWITDHGVIACIHVLIWIMSTSNGMAPWKCAAHIPGQRSPAAGSQRRPPAR